jgi:CTP:molybdopterin cytidylyltransferase MocA
MGLVLAAGASRRARCAKALVQLDGQSFVARALDTLRRGGCERAFASVARPYGATIRAAIGAANTLHIGTPELGMFASLKRGAEVARAFGYSILIVSLVDHPEVESATVGALLQAYGEAPAELLRPALADRRGHPILIADALLARVARAPATRHTRRMLDTADSGRDVPVSDTGIHQDLDTRVALMNRGRRLRFRSCTPIY